jgi:hypothetical protein
MVTFALWLLASASVPGAEEWVSIGPFGTPLVNNDVISGQLNAVALHPHDANTLYIGASEGGIWRTQDGGVTWRALTDTQLVRKVNGKPRGTLSIGAVAIDPINPRVIYAGTGNPHVACDTLFGPSLGVFRSTDAGDHWTPTGADLNKCGNFAMSFAMVNRFLVIPGSPPPVVATAARVAPGVVPPDVRPGRATQVLAATNMGLFSYREDGSDCWTPLTNGLPGFGNAVDIVADPFQRVLYVSFQSQGIFKSTDLTGTQWNKLTQGLPDSGFGWISLAFGGRTGIGFGQPQPIVYAGYSGSDGKYRLFKTVDGGGSWSELPSPPSENQVEFNNAIAVGSYDSNEVYVGQVDLWRASDGGAKGGLNDFKVDPPVTDKSWTRLSCCLVHNNPNRLGMDLHADNHDIQFAPYGSFEITPDQVQIVYVANDGGLAKGRIDFNGVVNWQSLTKGLAIGQYGTIGLDPGSPFVTAGGAWHNGDILLLSNFAESAAMAGGDGFQATIDAANLVSYVNCNAGFGGAICRLLPPAPFNTNFKSETIWGDNSARKHWSDPHRPGNLLRLQKIGLLFRTTVANSAPAATLNSSDAWDAVDPFFGKTGKTTTMAFRSRLLEETPVYYLGTDTGQVWRGSPEAGWTKLCECGAQVNAIAADLFRNERIFVVLKGSSGPGRIKEVSRQANGSWTAANIDTQFTPELDVQAIVSVAVDPTVPETRGTTVYVGTDQGVYRGHIDAPLVLDPTTSASASTVSRIVLPPTLRDWTWRRSPGVPNVWVLDLEVHQSFEGHDRSGVVRAGTYGRGIFELHQVSSTGPFEKPPLTVSVLAMQIGEDGAPSPLSVEVPVSLKDAKSKRETPFELAVPSGTEITLEAPREIKGEAAVLRFLGWSVPGKKPGGQPRIILKLEEAARAVAYYEKAESLGNAKAKPVQIELKLAAKEVCQRGFTHEVSVQWSVSEGQRPVTVRAEITYPDKHIENVELRSLDGSRPFPMNYPEGGEVRVKAIADDSSKEKGSAEATVKLKACRK